MGGLLLAFCLLKAGLADPVREARENEQWVKELGQFAQSQSDEVRHALKMILQDVAALARLDPHKAHDALQATLAKVDRARVDPQGAVQRERLDAPVGNFGEVLPGQTNYRSSRLLGEQGESQNGLLSGLFRGAQPSPQGLRWLKEQGITTVVILREPGVEETNYPHYSRADYLIDIRTLGMEPVEIAIKDHTVPTPTQIEQFFQAVDKARGPVFFHCSAGVGRTGILAGLYERRQGLSSEEALAHSKRFQLNPSGNPQHALQASLLANYPLPGRRETLDLPWPGADEPNPLAVALARGQGWIVPAGSEVGLDLSAPEPALARMAESLRTGRFLRFRFTSPQDIDVLASLARVIPARQKMAVMGLQDLGCPRGLSLADLERARRLLGPVPFEVEATGLKLADLAPARLEVLADLLAERAEVLDLNLPDGANPPVEVLKFFQNRGLACRLRFSKEWPKSRCDTLEVGYLASEEPASPAR